MRFLNFRFFHESVSPGHLSISLGPFQICTKIHRDIFNFVFNIGVKDTGDKLFASINDTSDTLLPVSLTPVIKTCPKF
jgi:hypothetical protein